MIARARTAWIHGMSRFGRSLPFLLLILLGSLPIAPASQASPTIATFSIIGYDPETGDLGVAVQSKFFAVGAVVPWARAGIGAIASQAYGNTTFGPRGLALLEEGLDVTSVLARLLAPDSLREQRQVGIVDAAGHGAAFTGTECMAWAGHHTGAHYTAQGNILVGEETVSAMARAFEETDGILGEKLMRALEAGQAAGGDSRGMQSAAMLIVRAEGGYGGYNDRYCDLRVDDHGDPIAELRRIFDMWKSEALIQEGYRLCEEGRTADALRIGEQLMALDPQNGEAFYHPACYYSKAGRREEALRTLARAVVIDSSLAPRAKLDTDFRPLWEDPDFLRIVGR